jgi:mRNA interferase RelE/StbE
VTYRIILPKVVQKQISKLPDRVRKNVLESLRNLQETPRPPNSLKMKNNQGYRLRIGEYRILYDIDDPSQTLTLRRVGHRREIYRDRT